VGPTRAWRQRNHHALRAGDAGGEGRLGRTHAGPCGGGGRAGPRGGGAAELGHGQVARRAQDARGFPFSIFLPILAIIHH
jgi:hypothetical protein